MTPAPATAIPQAPPRPPVTWAGMTRDRFASGRALGPVRLLVLHATAGSYPGDYNWLRRGGGDTPAQYISCHYYIRRDGTIAQFVHDHHTAYHCGPSAWTVDGQAVGGSHAGVARLNWLSIGVELENRNTGADPYPPAQVDAAVALFRHLAAVYRVPRSQVVRHLDIAPGRKTDPRAFAWPAFLDRVFAAPAAGYRADSPILAAPPVNPALLAATVLARCRAAGSPYAAEAADPIRRVIVPSYLTACRAGGVDPYVALAQMGHETGWLTSALSQRQDRDGNPLRNPAGIGVTNVVAAGPRPGFVWDADRGEYRMCVGFRDWARESVPAHIGRLVAYATAPDRRTAAQAALVAIALGARPLPLGFQGSATVLRELGRAHNPRGAQGAGWASPGTTYGASLAALAQALAGASR